MKNILFAFAILSLFTVQNAKADVSDVILDMFHGAYTGTNCELEVYPVSNGVKVNIRNGAKKATIVVEYGSEYYLNAQGRFSSSKRVYTSSVNYVEDSFYTIPTFDGRYVSIGKQIVNNRQTSSQVVECVVRD